MTVPPSKDDGTVDGAAEADLRARARERLRAKLAEDERRRRAKNVTIAVIAGVATLAVLATAGFFTYRWWDDKRHLECTWTDAAPFASPDDIPDPVATIQDQINQLPEQQRASMREQIDQALAQARDKQPQVNARRDQIRAAAAHVRTVDKPDTRQMKSGAVRVDLEFTSGRVAVTLDRHKAPCNVAAVLALVERKYYDDTPCHRITRTDGLKVLQCGDPTGTGASGPGFQSPDEPPTFLDGYSADATANPMTGVPPQQKPVTYPRGTVAMANSGPGTAGGQFFIVYQDSQLPPIYSVIGTLDEDGLRVVDQIADQGVDPITTLGESDTDGRPKAQPKIVTARVA